MKLSYQKPLLHLSHPPHLRLLQTLQRRGLLVSVLVLLSPLLLLSSVVPGDWERTTTYASRYIYFALFIDVDTCIMLSNPLSLLSFHSQLPHFSTFTSPNSHLHTSPNSLLPPNSPNSLPPPNIPPSLKVFQEARDLLQELPVGLLFDSRTVSDVWIDVVDRTMVFLIGVCQRCVESCMHPVREYGSM